MRKGEVFVRTGPNTFGLLELGHLPMQGGSEEPPPGFGKLKSVQEGEDGLIEDDFIKVKTPF